MSRKSVLSFAGILSLEDLDHDANATENLLARGEKIQKVASHQFNCIPVSPPRDVADVLLKEKTRQVLEDWLLKRIWIAPAIACS